MDVGGNAAMVQSLTQEGSYTVTVSMVGNGYFTAPSAMATLIVDGTPPSVPTQVRVRQNSVCMTLRVSWNAALDSRSGVDHYNIYRSVGGWSTYTFLASTATTSYDDQDLVPDTEYYYRVTAVDKAGNESNQSSSEHEKPEDDCADLSNLRVEDDDTLITARLRVEEEDTWVQITYSIIDKDTDTVVATFDHWAAPQFYANDNNYDISKAFGGNTLPPGQYRVRADLWVGSTQTSMHYNDQDSQDFTVDERAEINDLDVSNDETRLTTELAIREDNTWVQVEYRVVDRNTGTVMMTFSQWASPQFYANDNDYDVSYLFNGDTLPDGDYRLYAEVYAGATDTQLYVNDTRTEDFRVR